MKVEITIDRTKKLPDGAIPALQKELQKRLSRRYENCNLIIRPAAADSLSIAGAGDTDKKLIEEILQETCTNTSDWFDEN